MSETPPTEHESMTVEHGGQRFNITLVPESPEAAAQLQEGQQNLDAHLAIDQPVQPKEQEATLMHLAAAEAVPQDQEDEKGAPVALPPWARKASMVALFLTGLAAAPDASAASKKEKVARGAAGIAIDIFGAKQDYDFVGALIAAEAARDAEMIAADEELAQIEAYAESDAQTLYANARRGKEITKDDLLYIGSGSITLESADTGDEPLDDLWPDEPTLSDSEIAGEDSEGDGSHFEISVEADTVDIKGQIEILNADKRGRIAEIKAKFAKEKAQLESIIEQYEIEIRTGGPRSARQEREGLKQIAEHKRQIDDLEAQKNLDIKKVTVDTAKEIASLKSRAREDKATLKALKQQEKEAKNARKDSLREIRNVINDEYKEVVKRAKKNRKARKARAQVAYEHEETRIKAKAKAWKKVRKSGERATRAIGR